MATKAVERFTVSGPGVDKSYSDCGPALSAAITAAERLDGEGTFYVRDDEVCLFRVEHDASGATSIFTTEKAVA